MARNKTYRSGPDGRSTGSDTTVTKGPGFGRGRWFTWKEKQEIERRAQNVTGFLRLMLDVKEEEWKKIFRSR